MASVLALVSSIMWGSADFMAGRLSARFSPIAVVGYSQAFGLAVMIVLATATGSWSQPLEYVPWAVLAALAGALGLATFYQALASGSMGVVAPIASTGVVVPLVVAVVIGSRPSTGQWSGVVFALAGVVVATGPELKVKHSRRAFLLAAGAAACFGTALAAIAQGAQTSPIMTVTAMRLVIVASLGLVALAVGSLGGLGRPQWPALAAVGVLDVGANLAYGVSATYGQLAITAVLASMYPVVTMLLAWRILGERLARIQYLGVTAVVAGVMLITAL